VEVGTWLCCPVSYDYIFLNSLQTFADDLAGLLRPWHGTRNETDSPNTRRLNR
jgi:hypothetical protein